MATELEKHFFNAFGIEPDITSCYHSCKKDLNCKECNEAKVIYPQITDRILLELICIISCELGDKLNIKTLKKRIIQDSIYCYNDNSNEKFKQKVRTLFKEE